MTDRELMQQAQLEKLEGTLWILNQELTRKQAEIAALRERLAQPETVMAEYKHQTYAAYKTDGEMKIGVMPTTRPATREEKIVRPGVYEVTGPLHVVCQCDKCKAQPEQEPVAWVTGWHDGHCVIRAANPAAILPIGIALYTTPPRREWVGLTDEEKLHLEIMGGKSDVMLAETIEAKLKEKNA